MTKKELGIDLTTGQCQEIAERVKMGFEIGLSMAEGLTPEDVEPTGGLDGIIGGLSALRTESSIGWLLGVLVRARDERDKVQVEMELEDEEGESEEG